MLKISKIPQLLFATFASIVIAQPVYAEAKPTLTVVVNGIKHQKGQVCFRVFNSERGFPDDNTSEVASACTPIRGASSVQHKFVGLKPGRYAVAVLDDQRGDHKLHKDFFGIPKDGFGISNNPIVSISTGTPSFQESSFPLKKNTTINIKMKYSLDP